MTNKELKELDLKHIFHPCSQMKDYETVDLIAVKSGKGAYLFDYDGNRFLDAISSWWVNTLGHSNERINDAVKRQLDALEHTIFAGFTHKPAIDLAKKLVDLTPPKLQKVFFADNGSSAVEIALKMSFQYYKNQGEVRDIFISLENSYHGETMGALAVSDSGLYKDVFSEILLKTVQAPSPGLVSQDVALEGMRSLLAQYRGRVSAVIIEPLIQCAGFMKMYDASYVKALHALCDEFGVFLIHDEIAVGFGRTGTMFAYEQAGITPDFLCLSKGITGGYLPLSVVMLSDEIYGAFYCDYSKGKSFMDSHSYTGNALACAAACATLDVFEQDGIIQKNQEKIRYIARLLEKFKTLGCVLDVRQKGMVAAVELDFPPARRVGLEIAQKALKQGVLVRPLGNVLYFMPPYVFTNENLETMINVCFEIVKNLNK